MSKTKVGIIGCGNISGIYLQNLCHTFKNVDLVACSDLNMETAQAKVQEKNDDGSLKYPGVKAMTVEELLADDEIKIVVNLTTPQSHFNVAMNAINSGKSVHNEKPLTLSLEEGQKLLAAANEKGVRIGCAPDTFMGAGIQTCRKLIEDGWIGTPTSVTAFMCCPGHESWHPNPAFYYLRGGGPMFDMGPYYLTALVHMLGSVDHVAGMTGMAKEQRTCTSKARNGELLPVEVPTHVTGLLRFHSGTIGTLINSFDVVGHHLPNIEVHGTIGSLRVPDPNNFGGTVEYKRFGQKDWKEVPLTHNYSDNSRGIGVADMAQAITDSTRHRANGQLAYHVLEIMHALHDSSDQKTFVDIQSKVDSSDALDINAAY